MAGSPFQFGKESIANLENNSVNCCFAFVLTQMVAVALANTLFLLMCQQKHPLRGGILFLISQPGAPHYGLSLRGQSRHG